MSSYVKRRNCCLLKKSKKYFESIRHNTNQMLDIINELTIKGEFCGFKKGDLERLYGMKEYVGNVIKGWDLNQSKKKTNEIFYQPSWEQYGESIIGTTTNEKEGKSVAISPDGNYIATTARFYDNSSLNNVGRVQVFKRGNNKWDKIGENEIDGEFPTDKTGNKVEINFDGTVLAVTTHRSDYNSITNSSRVEIWALENNQWEMKIRELGSDTGDQSQVSLNKKGDIFSILYKQEDSTLSNYGKAQVYKIDSSYNHTLIGNIDISEELYNVDLNDEGNILSLSSENGVYIYKYDGTNWNQLGNIINVPNKTQESNIRLNSSGNIIAIGNIEYSNQKGIVTVYSFDGTTWNQIGQDLLGEQDNDYFGISVVLNKEGNILAASARQFLSGPGVTNGSGYVKFYKFKNSEWVEFNNKLVGLPNENRFGSSIDIDDEGYSIIIGSISYDTDISNPNEDLGRTIVYDGSGINFSTCLYKVGAKLQAESILMFEMKDIVNTPLITGLESEFIEEYQDNPDILIEDISEFLQGIDKLENLMKQLSIDNKQRDPDTEFCCKGNPPSGGKKSC